MSDEVKIPEICEGCPFFDVCGGDAAAECAEKGQWSPEK